MYICKLLFSLFLLFSLSFFSSLTFFSPSARMWLVADDYQVCTCSSSTSTTPVATSQFETWQRPWQAEMLPNKVIAFGAECVAASFSSSPDMCHHQHLQDYTVCVFFKLQHSFTDKLLLSELFQKFQWLHKLFDRSFTALWSFIFFPLPKILTLVIPRRQWTHTGDRVMSSVKQTWSHV